MKSKFLFAVYIGLFLSSVCLELHGQAFSNDWYKVAGGGGTSTNTQLALSGTIGQHDAGDPMSGGNFSLTLGYWSLSVAQTPGAPTLYIGTAGNTVTVYWQNVTGWALQQNANLTSSSGWVTSTGLTAANGTNHLNLNSPAGNLFFRLTHQ